MEDWKSILQTNNLSGFPKNWASLPEVRDAHIEILNELVNKEYIPPSYPVKRGIVICAGGTKYFSCAIACAYILKQLGCELPIEFWYLDEHEMDQNMKKLCDSFNISYVNTREYCKKNNINPRILNGFELKPFAALHSKFEQVLFLDADNIPVKNPSYLFDAEQFHEYGAVFWPDIKPFNRKIWLDKTCWNNIGLDYIDEPDFETGQFLIDKSKCYKELIITMWMNEHSDWFYKFVFGDKSTFHLAWRKCNKDYYLIQTPAVKKNPCLLQYDFDERILFQHATTGKHLIIDGTGPTNQYNYHLIKEAKILRDKYWNGKIYDWNSMSNEELKAAQQLIGPFNYTRVGLDSRKIVLSDNGEISEGSAKCEKKWSVKIIDNITHIVVIGVGHKDSEIAMFMAKDSGDGEMFIGRWYEFEKCKVIIEKIL